MTHAEAAPSEISKALITARRQARALDRFPGPAPASLAAAYAIQKASIKAWGDAVLGWKIGLIPPPFRAKFGTDRLAGPIFESQIQHPRTGELALAKFIPEGFGALEAEFVVRLSDGIANLSERAPDEELAHCIGALHIGVELAGSPLRSINELGPACIIADFGNNAGLVVGGEVPDWRERPLESLGVRTIIDGKLAGAGSAADIPEGPLSALRFLIGVCRERGYRLDAGTLVSTGAVTGIHEVSAGTRAVVDFGSFGQIELVVEATAPRG